MKNEAPKKHLFETSDFWIAATLMALGEKLSYLDRSNGPRVEFVFEPSPSLEGHISDYLSERLAIEPKRLFIQSRLLKSRLYDG